MYIVYANYAVALNRFFDRAIPFRTRPLIAIIVEGTA